MYLIRLRSAVLRGLWWRFLSAASTVAVVVWAVFRYRKDGRR